MSRIRGRVARRRRRPLMSGATHRLVLPLIACVSLSLGACSFGNQAASTVTPTRGASGSGTAALTPDLLPTGGLVQYPTALPARPTEPPETPTPAATPTMATAAVPTTGATPAPAASPTQAADRTKPALVINGETISFDQFDALLEQRYGARLADTLITERLLDQEAKKRKITVADSEIKAELSELQAQYPTEPLEAVVQQRFGLTLAELRDQLRYRLLAEKLVGATVKLTEDELRDYYSNKLDRFATPQEVRLERVVAETEANANAATQALRRGEKIAAVVQRYGSKVPSRAQQNGDTGFVQQEQLPQEVVNALSTVAINEVSSPVQLQNGGWVVAKVLARRGGDAPQFEQVRDRVLEAARNERISAQIPTYLEELRKNARIENQLAP